MGNITEILLLNLKRLRELRGWTQDDLAGHAGLSVATIQSLESGRTWLGLETIKALSKALEVESSVLFHSPELPLPHSLDDCLRVVSEAAKAKPAEPARPRFGVIETPQFTLDERLAQVMANIPADRIESAIAAIPSLFGSNPKKSGGRRENQDSG